MIALTLQLTAAVLGGLSPRVALGQERATDPPIGVATVPLHSGHSSSVEDRITVIENALSTHPRTHILKFKDPLLDDSSGKQLELWLNNGKSAIIYRITPSNVGGCANPPQYPKCVKIEPFVVDLLTGQTISRPTAPVQHDHPSFLYNEGLVPISEKAIGEKIKEYVFLAHPGLTQTISNDKPEMWRVMADGSNAKPVAQPFLDTGSHGCAVSPDGQFLACEPPPRYPLEQHGIRLSLIDGTKPTYIKRGEERIGLGFVVWQPDSSGFLYYSYSNSRDRGWLVYCHIDGPKLHSDDENERKAALDCHVLAPDLLPSQFCLGTSEDLAHPPPCRPYGTGNLGSDLPVWSPDSKWVYYSALNRSTGTELPRRVIGRVLISKPETYEPLTLEFGREAGHPTISPHGGAIAFSATTSAIDSRTQVFVLIVKTKRMTQLTSFGSDEEGYAPQWWDWADAKRP
jgi:WD40-like Beta Propeller Repeat